jgi:cell division protein ZapA
MKQIEVQIMGQSYLLGCPEGGETQLRDAVDRVDAAMCKIRDAGKVKARDRIAVLASLNLAFDLAAQQAAAAAAPASTPAPANAVPAADAGEDDAKAAQLKPLRAMTIYSEEKRPARPRRKIRTVCGARRA